MGSRFLSLLLLALTVVSPTLGHQSDAMLSHRQEYNIRGETAGTYLNSKHDVHQSHTSNDIEDAITIATKYVAKLAPGIEYRLVNDHYTDEDTGITHAYFFQTFEGIDIENTQINVNVKRDGNVLSAGTNFVPMDELKSLDDMKLQPELDPAEALRGVFERLKFPGNADNAVAVPNDSVDPNDQGESYTIIGVDGVLSVRFIILPCLSSHRTNSCMLQKPTAHLKYYHTTDGLKLVWKLETDFGDNWLISYADAEEKGKVYSVADYVADASYLV